MKQEASGATLDTKTKLLEAYKATPMNLVGAADACGISIALAREIRGMNLREFQEIEDRYFLTLEHLVYAAALGKQLPLEYEEFSFSKALTILKHRFGWKMSQKIEIENRAGRNGEKGNGKGDEIIDSMFARMTGGQSGADAEDGKPRNPLLPEKWQ